MKKLCVVLLLALAGCIGKTEHKGNATPSILNTECFGKMYCNDSTLFGSGTLPQGMMMVYRFNGECSSCIAGFISFMQNIRDSRRDVPVFIVCRAYGYARICFYMEKNGVDSCPDVTLLLDRDGVFDDGNRHLNYDRNEENVFLVNGAREIVLYGNPFRSNSLRKAYRKTGVRL